MKKLKVEVAVIGGGTAGLAAYRSAKEKTDSVILIEGAQFGTTCARVGCMPSKLLIAAAEAAHSASHTEPFGVFIDGKIRVDGKKVMQRIRDERDRFVSFVVEAVDSLPAPDKVIGNAKFISTTELQIGDHTIVTADRMVIATGSRPSYPGVWNELGDKLIINDDLFNWTDLPKSIAVFGPGVIGLELGQSLHRLGVEVLMFGMGGQVGPFTDPQVMAYAQKTFSDEFYLDADANVKNMVRKGENVEITYLDKQGIEQVTEVEYVLAATGRRANVDNLGLENIEIEKDGRGVPIADRFTMQTSVPSIFIAGDASNQLPLLHEAADQGKIAGSNAAVYPNIRVGLRRSSIAAVFTEPQLAMVGLTHQQVTEKYTGCDCFETGSVSFESQGRSRVILKNQGLLNIYGAHGTGRFLGAEMIGPQAEHLAHLLAWAHQNRMTISQMLDMPFYHPVIEEGVRTALRDLNAKLRLGSEMLNECMECGPGC
ncbi:pyridine nucleotide-disulfide oxidoreductase dimerization region [Psychromonas ingrahamii 37]|uniref:Pyridine nucleotide-disulfide oxidoreductase dimerization region n=1 Tax=Psychromonas ingrahamii (strain DSM 17664 / CCUG 51855 / 37) TaxID=357804 RepID=A1T089_PSYIN|nr:dihydrolipoyl dehydrogenase [Psychromonas ingrahamii]ABM05154.1 pyridine nucleotide-disulfide oxidoreductase dimerization region [Psychromonas ingrahamii 37]